MKSLCTIESLNYSCSRLKSLLSHSHWKPSNLKVQQRHSDLRCRVFCLQALAEKTERCTGAELESVCREAALAALREDLEASEVRARHFEASVAALRPGLSDAAISWHQSWGS